MNELGIVVVVGIIALAVVAIVAIVFKQRISGMIRKDQFQIDVDPKSSSVHTDIE